ncbi:MAG: PD-(D/E)XK nuclease family protein, partial [Daejeonella sp.]
LGMNEGVLPKVSITPSFIPDNVRRAFGLPVLENQNSIFAYFFYRLLHCAKKVTLVYNGITDESSGEESRFIKQLEFETSCKFRHVLQQNQPINNSGHQIIEVEKNGTVLDKLQRYFKRNSEVKYDKKISASAFTDYISCPLKFFFGKIAGLSEPNDLPDQIGPHTVGTMLHSVMENFYRDSVGKEVTPEYIRQREKLLPSMSEAAMALTLNLDPANELQQSALQQIIIRVIEQYAKKVLRHDEKIAPFVIRELEEKDAYTPLFSIEVDGKEQQVRLMGIIDRVDVHENKTRIVDYKTGKDQLKYNDFEGLFSEEGKDQNKALLQTLFYTFVYEKARNVNNVEPHLYTVKEFKGGTLFSTKGRTSLKLIDENLADLKDQFEGRLKEKLNELFDPAIPFRQTTNTDACKYCAFKGICQR